MPELPFRQIHMDFHTAPDIPNVGSDFDATEFIETLKSAHVNGINLFAKCHHGMYYYPTKIGTMHPTLKFDLLGEQVKACRQANIRVGIYTTVVWNEEWCDRHPEWMAVSHDGTLGIKKPHTANVCGWRYLCQNNPNLVAYLKAEATEICECFKPDAYWIDIAWQMPGCMCRTCTAERKSLGIDHTDQHALRRHARLGEIRFMKDMTQFLKTLAPAMDVFYNSRIYEPDQADDADASARHKREHSDFIDIESLPSETWGYTHFPINVNYVNKYPKEITMMNGKFHKEWGDFGSLRNIEALEYECFRGLANGAKICIGDQLHPSGKIDKTVYNRIGQIFASIEAKEPWCKNTKKISQIGIFTPNKVVEPNNTSGTISEGVYRIMSELHHLFDFIDFQDDLAGYDLLILPDDIRLPPDVATRINTYLHSGGKLFATAMGGLAADKDFFAIDALGVTYQGPAEYKTRYTRLSPEVFAGLPPMDYVTYEQGTSVEARPNTQILAHVVNPYYNRTWDHFCSHRQTPPNKLTTEPCIVKSGNCIYLSNPLFKDYAINGCRIFKETLKTCLDILLPNPLLRGGGQLPSLVETALRRQDDKLILHILSYIIQRKCRTLDIIEEKLPLLGQEISVRTGVCPAKVYSVPDKKDLPFSHENSYTRIRLPEGGEGGGSGGHYMIVIE
ncbi:MAG: alpha-L-fucosidase [Phycisphaerales bacterium]|nr:alpha-L-fucosidase [Phycisphaerales bacterium]